MSEYYKNLDKKKNNVTIFNMVIHIYYIRDVVSKLVRTSFSMVNDASAVRDVQRTFSKAPEDYKDIELWRSGFAYDNETMEQVPDEKAVIALPPLAAVNDLPLGQGAAKVELKQ